MTKLGVKDTIFNSWKRGSVLVTDSGWGDSGKGKVISALNAQVGVRSIGGHNAGHTVVTSKGEFGLGLIPTTIVKSKTLNIIGQDVVINPFFLVNEINSLIKGGVEITSDNLKIDPRSHLVLPWHQLRDALSEEMKGKFAVGSLHLGVGWAYVDRLDRRGLRVYDLTSKNLKERIYNEIKFQRIVLSEMKSKVKRVTKRESEVNTFLNAKKIVDEVNDVDKIIKKHIDNTTEVLYSVLNRKRVLFEDAHGMMLDLSHGSWPYTTGVHVGLGGVYRSFGGRAVRSIDRFVVSLKAYQTRVGGGIMPSEDFGDFGNYVRDKGGEFGTRSGRSRRCGAFDAPITRLGLQAAGINQNDEIALTKLDVLTGLDSIPVCVAYKYQGGVYSTSPYAYSDFLENVKPVFVELPGWKEDITEIRKASDLPLNALNYIWFIQELLGCKISVVGVGKHMKAIVFTNGLSYNGPRKYKKYL